MHLILPRYLALEVTRACNYTCGHCGVDAGRPLPGELSREEIFGLLDKVRPDYTAITGGEPLLRGDIFEILDRAASHGVVRLNTNGSLIDAAAARRMSASQILISLDAMPGGNTMRGGDNYAHVESALKHLEAAGKLRRVVLCITVSEDNADEPERIIRHFSPRVRNFGLLRLSPIGRADGKKVLSRLGAAKLYARLLPYRLKNSIFFFYEFGAFLRLATNDLTVMADGSLIPCCLVRRPFANIRTAKRLPWLPKTCLLFCSGCADCGLLAGRGK